MKALKYQVKIGRDHRVVVEVPRETPEGPAEVILLVPDAHEAPRDALHSLLAEFRSRPGGRSKDDIDAALVAERASWGE